MWGLPEPGLGTGPKHNVLRRRPARTNLRASGGVGGFRRLTPIGGTLRVIVVFTVGVAVGAAGVLLRTRSPTAPLAVAPSASAPSAPPPASVAVPTDLPACAQQVSALTVENSVLRKQLASYGGVRSEWPEQVAAAYEPQNVRDWLTEALPGLPVTLEQLDCDEYPCLMVVRYADGEPAASTVVDPLRDGFVAETGGSARPFVGVYATAHASFAILAFAPPDLDVDADRRLQVRVDELGEALSAERE